MSPRLLPLAALPAVAIAVTGLAHPVLLTAETAERWRLVHLLLLPLFPLMGAAVWVVLLGRRGAVAWAARLLAAGFALLYTALDSIAGIGGGHQVQRAAARGDGRPPVEDLYDIGDALGRSGVVLLAVAFVLTAVALRAAGPPAWAGGLLAALCCWGLLRHHVFPPRGVLAVLGIAGGTALLGLAAARGRTAHEDPVRPPPR